ncbi:uncharacterized protein LOC143865045 [Tasmannia lanceolata]|uniref:uncharacterized protein LOC143865045 n=1 Tax=Tasmannia lanceolata TaxID=3420 RepID=UPI0040644338
MKKPYAHDILDEWERETASPFTSEILKTLVEARIDLSRFGFYDGSIDPLEFLQTFRRVMALQGASDGFMCRAFTSLLRKTANDWYMRLEPDSIASFHEFERKFTARFDNNRLCHYPADALLALRQGRNEALRDFMLKFNAELAQLSNIDVQIAVAALKHATTDPNLKLHITLKPPRDLQELESKPNKFIRAEEACARERSRAGPEERRKEEGRGAMRPRAEANWNPIPVFERLGSAPLKVPLSHLLFAIRDQGLLTPPRKMSTDPKKRSTGKFCDFHGDHGHETNHCFHLRLQLEKLAKEGHLNQYLKSPAPIERSHEAQLPADVPKSRHRSRSRHWSPSRHRYPSRHRSRSRHDTRHHRCPERGEPPQQNPTPEQPPTIVGKINIIAGGPTAGDSRPVSLRGAGSSVNVLHLGTFEEMKLAREDLGLAEYSIYGFSWASVRVSGKIDLPVSFGTYPLQKTIMTTFMVVDIPFTYSAIIGRPALRDLGAVVSTPHLKMKFPTQTGIGEVRGQHMMARQCYAASLRGSNAPAKNFTIGSEDPRERARTIRGEPTEELDSIPISENQPEKQV